jgi:hypothetical protein
VGAVGRLATEAIPKNEDTTCERLRVNLIHETHGFVRAVDQTLVVDEGCVALVETNGGEHVAPDMLLNVGVVTDFDSGDCVGEGIN